VEDHDLHGSRGVDLGAFSGLLSLANGEPFPLLHSACAVQRVGDPG